HGARDDGQRFFRARGERRARGNFHGAATFGTLEGELSLSPEPARRPQGAGEFRHAPRLRPDFRAVDGGGSQAPGSAGNPSGGGARGAGKRAPPKGNEKGRRGDRGGEAKRRPRQGRIQIPGHRSQKEPG